MQGLVCDLEESDKPARTVLYVYIAGEREAVISIAIDTMEPDPQAAKASIYPFQETKVIVPASVDSIRTQNLYLRRLELADAADLYEFRSRQDVADWL